MFYKFIQIIFAVFLLSVPCGYGVIFNCNYQVMHVSMLNQVYACNAEVTEAVNTTLFIRGQHTGQNEDANVECLLVIDQNMTYIPSNIDEYFPNLKCIAWDNSGLRTLISRDLQQFPKLIRLQFISNSLTYLDGNLFQYTLYLRAIDFESNRIGAVGENLLSNLTNLEFADFRNNICINLVASRSGIIEELEEALHKQCRPSTTITSTSPEITTTETTTIITDYTTTTSEITIATQPITTTEIASTFDMTSDSVGTSTTQHSTQNDRTKLTSTDLSSSTVTSTATPCTESELERSPNSFATYWKCLFHPNSKSYIKTMFHGNFFFSMAFAYKNIYHLFRCITT